MYGEDALLQYLKQQKGSKKVPLYGETFSSSLALQASSRKSSIRSREIRDWLNTNLRKHEDRGVSGYKSLWCQTKNSRPETGLHFIFYFLCHAQDLKQKHHLSRVLQDLSVSLSDKLPVPVGRGTPWWTPRGPSCLWNTPISPLAVWKFKNNKLKQRHQIYKQQRSVQMLVTKVKCHFFSIFV